MWKKVIGACVLLIITSGCHFQFKSHTGDECTIDVLSGHVYAELDPETGKVKWDRGGWYKASGIEFLKEGTDYSIEFDTSETEKISVEQLIALRDWWLTL